LLGSPEPSGIELPQVAGAAHSYVSVDGVRLHYAEAGNGPVVVLLHGWPQHWWMWRDLITPLAEEYRVICPDFRGWNVNHDDGDLPWHSKC
jgi:pimeloyl-ACP methyl ester carboxylesterase